MTSPNAQGTFCSYERLEVSLCLIVISVAKQQHSFFHVLCCWQQRPLQSSRSFHWTLLPGIHPLPSSQWERAVWVVSVSGSFFLGQLSWLLRDIYDSLDTLQFSLYCQWSQLAKCGRQHEEDKAEDKQCCYMWEDITHIGFYHFNSHCGWWK